jgi:hypothetical protein
MGDGTMTFFCSVCDEVSIVVHSEWEASERYGWYKNKVGEWVCCGCAPRCSECGATNHRGAYCPEEARR